MLFMLLDAKDFVLFYSSNDFEIFRVAFEMFRISYKHVC